MEGPVTEALDVVVLQEVGGLREIKCKESSGLGSLRELSFPEESELVDYRVFGTWEGDSHLSQMILLDESVVDSVIDVLRLFSLIECCLESSLF